MQGQPCTIVAWDAMSESFGKEIHTRRTEIGMSQARLAELVGRSTSTVRSWEKGRTSPSPASLDALKAILGLSEYDEETVMEMPAIVAGVAPESYKPASTTTASVLREAQEVKEREFEQALENTEFFDVKAAPEVDLEPDNAEVEWGQGELGAVEVVALSVPQGTQSTQAVVSFVDRPTGSIRYIARILSTLVVLGGMAVVGKWAAGGALDIVKGVWASIKAALGS